MMSSERQQPVRLDQYLVARGDFMTRAQAQAAIRAGCVRVDGEIASKSSQKVEVTAKITAEAPHPWVSRGGVKLAAALEAFGVDPAGLDCLDLGASTGGFTDVLLQSGAARVACVDVGRGQLHPKIADDPRVTNLEQTHTKDLSADVMPFAPQLIVVDVSFISLRLALPPALALATPGSALVALVKPQFEVGREGLGKCGIANPEAADRAVAEIRDFIDAAPGWRVKGLIESPIRGGDGNREHLLHAVQN